MALVPWQYGRNLCAEGGEDKRCSAVSEQGPMLRLLERDLGSNASVPVQRVMFHREAFYNPAPRKGS